MQRYWFLLFWLFPWWTICAQTSPSDYRAIDRHARRAPADIAQDLPALSEYLVAEAENEMEKLRAIYTWITHNIRYDGEAYRSGRRRINRNIRDILRRQQAVCMGYSQLLKAMCDEAALDCELVSGYSKGTLTTTPGLQRADHAWNAVRLEGQWYLLDATWGASLQQRGNEFVQVDREMYFLTPPEQFILHHLPSMPMWQLLSAPIDPATFQQPADSITAYLASGRPTFHFEDSIRHWRTLARSDRRLWAAKTAFAYHPTKENRSDLGHTYMDYAGDLSDSIDQLPPERSLDTLISLQSRVIEACRQARQYTDTLYNWQRELHINALINQAAALYQQVYDETDEVIIQNAYVRIQDLLHSARDIIAELPPNSFYGRQMDQRCEQYLKVIRPYLPKE